MFGLGTTQSGTQTITQTKTPGDWMQSLVNPFMQEYQKNIGGNYLYGGEGFNAAQQAAANRIIPQVQGAFNRAGRLNSGLAQGELTRQLADSFAAQYGNERQNQLRALGMFPSLLGETTDTPLYSNQLAELLGLGLTGAGIVDTLFGGGSGGGSGGGNLLSNVADWFGGDSGGSIGSLSSLAGPTQSLWDRLVGNSPSYPSAVQNALEAAGEGDSLGLDAIGSIPWSSLGSLFGGGAAAALPLGFGSAAAGSAAPIGFGLSQALAPGGAAASALPISGMAAGSEAAAAGLGGLGNLSSLIGPGAALAGFLALANYSMGRNEKKQAQNAATRVAGLNSYLPNAQRMNFIDPSTGQSITGIPTWDQQNDAAARQAGFTSAFIPLDANGLPQGFDKEKGMWDIYLVRPDGTMEKGVYENGGMRSPSLDYADTLLGLMSGQAANQAAELQQSGGYPSTAPLSTNPNDYTAQRVGLGGGDYEWQLVPNEYDDPGRWSN